jgi:hypothetical protein
MKAKALVLQKEETFISPLPFTSNKINLEINYRLPIFETLFGSNTKVDQFPHTDFDL